MSVATEWLERVRKASAHIEVLTRDLSALEDAKVKCLPWQTKGSGVSVASGGPHSDPTQRDALAREGLEEQIKVMGCQLEECEETVGKCLKVLSLVSKHVGEKASLALEIYYVDCASTWSEVAYEMGVSLRHVYRVRDSAYAWLDVNAHLY